MIKGHRGLWNREDEKMIDPLYPREGKLNMRVWTDIELSDTKLDYHVHHLSIYTDVSKGGNEVGLGWVVCEGDYVTAKGSMPLKEVDIHAADVLAIFEALEWTCLNLCRE